MIFEYVAIGALIGLDGVGAKRRGGRAYRAEINGAGESRVSELSI